MKKIFVTIAIVLLLLPIFTIPSEATSELAWSNVKNVVDGFVRKADGSEVGFDASKAVSGLATILTTIGVVIVLGGLLIIGIKYMTAKPEEAAKLKTRLVGLVLAGLVILGAYGIWLVIGNVLNDVSPTYNQVLNTNMNPTPTARPVVTATATPSKPTENLGEIYTGNYQGTNYWASIPDNTDISSYDNIPLIVYLHGNGITTLKGLTSTSDTFVSYITSGKATPKAVFIAPVTPSTFQQWNMINPNTLKGLIDQVISELKEKGITVDRSNMSITGHSLGGAAAFEVLKAQPTLFNKALLTSPQCNTAGIGSVKADMRIFFGGNEGNKVGSPAKSYKDSWGTSGYSTVIPGKDHGSITLQYCETDNLEWLVTK